MAAVNLGKNIMKYRREAGITQEQLAEYMGVSKSSISKWETENAYPDILLLPELATLFNISVDKLMGYEPQLTKKKIIEIYRELAEAFPKKPDETYIRSEELIKKYYSCFPFLYEMAVLYVNHAVLFEDQSRLLNSAKELCIRVKQGSDDAALIKDAVSLEAVTYIAGNEPAEVLALLGEEVKPISQDAELIGVAYQQSGDMKEARKVFQVCAYQHLLFVIQDSVNIMMLSTEDKEFCYETIQRLEKVIELYNIDELHSNTSVQFYIAAATIYAMHGQKSPALEMIEKYTSVALKNFTQEYKLQGDSYFTEINEWFTREGITGMPRGLGLVKETLAAVLEQTPAFEGLKEEFRFRSCLEKLKNS